MSDLRLTTYGAQLADHAPPVGHVEIDGDPLMLTEGGYDVSDTTPFGPKVTEGASGYGNYQPYDSPVAQSSWHGGYGQKRADTSSDTVGYFEGHDVEADRSRIIPAPPKVWETLPDLGDESNARRSWIEYHGTLLHTAGSMLYARLDAAPGWIRLASFPRPCRDLEVYGSRCYVALGPDTPLQHSADLATWTPAADGAVAEALCADRSALYRGWSNQVQATTVGTAWTEPVALVGDSSAPITSLLDGGGLVNLWVGKTDGLWGIPTGAGGTAAHYLNFDRRDPDNCWPLTNRGGLILVPNGNGLWEFQPSSQTSGAAANISPGRDADALGQVRGRVVGVTDSLRYTMATLYDDASVSSYVVRRDSRTGRWHTWLTIGGSIQASTLFFRQHDLTDRESPPHLFVGAGTAGVGRVILPANGDDPLSDPNCFPPEVRVSADTDVLAIGRRAWSGELVKIATDGEHQLTGTPNHPVLTDRGWVPLGAITEGDDVVCGGGCQEIAFANAHEHDADASLGEIFELATFFGAVVRSRPGAKEQFHGDGQNGDVDVVTIDRELKDRIEAALAQPVGEDHFALPYERELLLPKQRAAARFLVGNALDVPGYVSGSGHARLLFGSHSGPAERGRLPDRARGNAGLLEAEHDRGWTNTERASDSRRPLASQITMHKVLNIQHQAFRGHVYNLQTRAGSYTANGITTHNCRYVIDHIQSWQPEVTLPELDFTLPDERKTLLTVRLSSRRLMGAWRWVEVAYMLDADGRWRTDLDAGRGPHGDARSSPIAELSFPEITQCRTVALRLRFFNMDPEIPPEVTAVAIHGRVAVQNKWHWNLTGVLGRAETAENLALIERNTFLFERKLQRLREEAKPCSFKDPDGYPWRVLVDRIRVRRSEEAGRLPEWQVNLALTQAVPQLDHGHQAIFDYPIEGEEGGLYDTESYFWSP